MKACLPENLDGYVYGELSPAESAKVAAHVSRCSACAHEVAWLKSERVLFEQRALVQSVRPSPSPSTSPSPSNDASPRRARREGRRTDRIALALAASLLVFFSFDSGPMRTRSADPIGTAHASEGFGLSVDPQWQIATLEQRYGACLVASPSDDFRCGQ
jgi:anti-sigma factor RsiW